MVKLEVIATCVEDALLAEECGADRLELITAITEGGLTPSIGMIQQVVDAVHIPVNVMVRPHSRSFVYGKHDIATMAGDIEAIATAGAAGIVIGALTADGEIDTQLLDQLLPLSGELDVTFHRAFDELANRPAALEILMSYPQISRVLTSGGLEPALQAVPELRDLVAITRDRDLLDKVPPDKAWDKVPVPLSHRDRGTGSVSHFQNHAHSQRENSFQILAGHGLTIEGIEDFIAATGVTEVHFGSAVRLNSSALAPIDPIRLKALASKIHSLA